MKCSLFLIFLILGLNLGINYAENNATNLTVNATNFTNNSNSFEESGDSAENFLFREPRSSFRCKLPKMIGPCQGRFIRWYYDRKSGFCKRFIYGGCRGNGNNFRTRQRCERRCRP